MIRLIVGVDEAGRGPLAGPVAVGAVALAPSVDIRKVFPGVADSKVLTPEKREEIYDVLQAVALRGEARFFVSFSSSAVIDTRGISAAVRHGVWRAVRKVAPVPENTFVYLDGLLHAPSQYAQQTIIHGDSLEPIISLASIAAKVERDRLMCRMAKRFPAYGFEVHKGYGTLKHRQAIRELGLSDMHRRSFCHI